MSPLHDKELLQKAVAPLQLWTISVLRALSAQHAKQAELNKAALLEHKAHARLVKLAAKMSDDDYEHAGPVGKSNSDIMHANMQRTSLQESLKCCKAELGMSCPITYGLPV